MEGPATSPSTDGREFPWRGLAITTGIVVVVVVVIGMAGLVRAATMPVPRLRKRVVMASTVRFPGQAPVLSWPTAGEAAVSVDGVGDVGTSGGDTPEPIASVAKMMTAYLILRDRPLGSSRTGFSITITAAEVADEAARAKAGQSIVAVQSGEVLDEYQLLEALLLPSANNVAAILADYDAGSLPAFLAKMNAAAKGLQMDHTEYTDPSGFTPTTVSTASDQLRLAKVVMRIPVFATIVKMKSVTLPVAGTLNNYNSLVGRDGFVGVKTGSEGESGGCLVFADDRTVDGHRVTILGVILGQDRFETNTATILGAAATAATKLADSATASLSIRSVIPAGRTAMEVTNAEGDQVIAKTGAALRQLGWGGLRLRVRLTTTTLNRDLTAGERVGGVEVQGRLKAEAPVVAAASMPEVKLGWRLEHVLDTAVPVTGS
jgi:serine-type D-Ala-D-Ala carboxypeptidase (penicillin-binding protein 5/6)